MNRFSAVAFFTCAFLASALAADAGKVDFTTIILDVDNNPIYECADPANLAPTDAGCKDKRALTLGIIASRALLNPEQGISQDESMMRGQLALNLIHATSVSLKTEEKSLIKKRIAAMYGPLIVARTFPLIDPAEAK